MMLPAVAVPCAVWRAEGGLQHVAAAERSVPEETAIAFSYDGGTYAVMMATPDDLADFALGFSRSEGIVASPGEIERLQIVAQDGGIELRMWLTAPRAAALGARRRHMAGPTGCGLCGVESLAAALRPVPRVSAGREFTPAEIMQALEALAPRQALNRRTRAVHAAAFWRSDAGLVALREDIGRHNALDKLGGALARDAIAGADGLAVLTSRVSVEMVQKAAALDIPILVAISAPTALALRVADAAGITLVAVARRDGFEIFTHPQRVAMRRTGAHSSLANMSPENVV